MAYQRPTLQDLITRIESDYESRLVGGGTLLRRSVVKVMARVQAGAIHLIYGFGFYIARQLMPDTAEHEYLRRWARIWGVFPKVATYANIPITFTGPDGIALLVGTELVRSDGVIYTTDATVTTAGGIGAAATATAKDSGAVPNLSGGEILTMSSPIAGISSEVVVGVVGIVDGVDEETDESLLERLLERIQYPPSGGSKSDYEAWAKEVAGVTRAWCYPKNQGPGTVGLTFVMDNQAGTIIPSGAKVIEVQTYIDDASRRPVTADLTVYAPIASPLNFTITGIADATVRAAVQVELDDLIRREAVPAGTLLLSRIQEAISKAKGETDHGLTLPAANVTTAAAHISTMGVITWA